MNKKEFIEDLVAVFQFTGDEVKIKRITFSSKGMRVTFEEPSVVQSTLIGKEWANYITQKHDEKQDS